MSKKSICYKENIRSFGIQHWNKRYRVGRLQSESYHNVQSRQKRHMIRKSSERFKRRKDLRAIKKHWIDKSKEQEGKHMKQEVFELIFYKVCTQVTYFSDFLE